MFKNRLVRGPSLWLCGIAAGISGLLVPVAMAQPPQGSNQLPQPRLTTVFPCGGKAGTTLEVAFTGSDIEEPDALFFSDPGIKAEPIGPTEAAPVDPNKKPPGRRAGPPAKLVVSKWKVTIAPNVAPGNQDVRLVNKWGISNPRTFVVGDLTEVQEKEPNNDVPEAQRVAINTTINGNLASPTDVDYYVFTGKKGQRVVASCLTSSIDSRMNACLEMFDTADHRLAENRNYSGDDALVDFTLPADGDYYVRVFEFTHLQGNTEFFYRLSITTAPWIDAIYPPVVEPGKPAKLTVYGRNLPGGKLDPTALLDGRALETLSITVDPPKDPAAFNRLTFSGHVRPAMAALNGFEYRIKNEIGTSNPYLLTYARAPVVLDNEKNDTPETAQHVAVPCEIVGRIEKKRDRDWYSFDAKLNDVYSIDVISDRIGAPTDMEFSFLQTSTKSFFGDFDDNPETLSPIKFFTRSNDPPRHRFEVKTDKAAGKYEILVKSQDGDVRAGPRHLYRLVIAPEKPDFHLIIMPTDDRRTDAGQVLKGGNAAFTAFVWRHDGFNGAVTVSAEGLPAGVTCAPQIIGPGQRQAAIVISATAAAAAGIAEIKFKGQATIKGKPEIREGRVAGITWETPPQQNIPTVARLDRNFMLAVREQAPFALSMTIDKNELKPGDKANVTVKLTRLWPDFKVNLVVTGFDLPNMNNQPNQPGITINNNQPITLAPGKDEFKGVLDVKATMAPGTYNVVLKGVAQIPYNKDPMNKQKPNISVAQPSTALAVIVVPKQLAAVTLPTPTVNVKAGMNAEVVVKLARQADYEGEFKVKVTLPGNAAGVTIDELTILAGQSEGKLVVKVTPEASPVNLTNLVVLVTGNYEGRMPIVQEAKLNLNVAKK